MQIGTQIIIINKQDMVIKIEVTSTVTSKWNGVQGGKGAGIGCNKSS